MNGVDKRKLMRKTVLFFLLLLLLVFFFHFGTVGGRVRPSGGSDYSNPTLGFSLLGNQPGS